MAEAQSEPVNTFSVVFDQPEYDESQWSSLVAKKFNTRHHPVLLKTGDFLSRIPDALKAMDHPSPDGINTFVVSGAVRNEGIKVALTGLGGDELFSGYPQFSQIDRLLTQWKLWFRIHPGIRKSLASWLPKFKPSRRSEALARLLSVNRGRFSDLYPCYRELYNSAQIESLISSDSYVDPVTSYFQNAGINLMSLDFFAKMSHAELLNYASPVLLQDADQMSMAHGLEVRVPFFDPDLVTFIMSLPDSIRRGKYPKQLLVESLGDLIPPEVVNRPKKGFDLPYDNWLKHELKSFVNTHIESLSARKPFHEKSVRAVWNSYLEGDSHFRWNHIMSLVALESWIQKLVVK